MESFEQDAHGFLLCGFRGASLQPCLLEGFGGGFLAPGDKTGVGYFVGMVFSQVVQQVQPVVGQFRRSGSLVLFHFLMDLVDE